MDTTDSCLDAETLAAWIDGGLSEPELERAQTHVADCVRCQALVGTVARTSRTVPASVAEPDVEPDLRVGKTRFTAEKPRWLPWLVPLTAAAAAIAVWIMVPSNAIDQRTAMPRTPTSQSQDAKVKPEERAASAALAAPNDVRDQEMRRDAASNSKMDRLEKRETTSGAGGGVAGGIPPGVAGAAPPGPTASLADSQAAPSADTLMSGAAREIVSPDPKVRWRIAVNAGNIVQRSANGGATWENTPAGISTSLTAGSAPSPMVCWLVGRGGVVLLSADGDAWRRVPFPEMTDLSGVRARDARSASVTTADGRTLSTVDAGSTWTPGPLQGF